MKSIFSFPGEGSTACDFSAVPGPVWWAVWLAMWCAVRCAVDPDRYPPMLASLMPLISMPHPLGGGSQNHPWQIHHGRTIYWWRRQPHHQKSNRHWDFMLPEFKCPAWETTLVCDRFIAPPRDHRIVPTSLCCFQQITRKVIRRIGPQERKQDEVVM